jgi:hypothetical protein
MQYAWEMNIYKMLILKLKEKMPRIRKTLRRWVNRETKLKRHDVTLQINPAGSGECAVLAK